VRIPHAAFAVVMCASTALHADESSPAPDAAAYANIGRVFMSPAERSQLDRLRKSFPVQVAGAGGQDVSSSANPLPADEKARPAGYIVPSNGLPYKWADGDFRRTTPRDLGAGQLPGTVSIIRHERAATESGPTSPPGKASEQDAAGETVSESETGHDDAD
jgi:hypothetical protein